MRLTSILLAAILSCSAFAALPGDSVWQVQTVSSSDSNGGCWSNANKGATGVDHSTGAGTTFTSTLSAVGTTTLTDSGAGFLNTMLGNCIAIEGQGTYNIQTFTDTGHVVVDRALGTFSTTSGHEGGPILSLGHLCGLLVAGNVAYFKADGTFTITSASTNADAGTCSKNVPARFVGYTSNRTINNTDARPTIQTNVSTATMFASGIDGITVYNFILDGNSQTASKLTTAGQFVSCDLKNFTAATSSTNANLFFNVTITGSSAVVIAGTCVLCEAWANTSTPIACAGVCADILSYSNTGVTTDGVNVADQSILWHVAAYNNGRDGIRNVAGSTNAVIANSYAESNVGTGFNNAGASSFATLNGFGYFGNGTDLASTALTAKTTAITPASSAFVSSTNLNTNSTANAGALLRSVAVPATFPRGLTSTYEDVNAARHQDPSNVTVGVPTVQ